MSENEFDDLFEPKLTRADVRAEVEKTLRDVSAFGAQSQAAVANAIREVTALHPDFEQMRPKMLATLDQLPLLKDAINAAEANPQLGPTLPALYEIVFRASQAPTANASTAEPSKPSESLDARPSDLSDEGVQHQAALASQRIDLSPKNRKSLIAELERRGAADIEF